MKIHEIPIHTPQFAKEKFLANSGLADRFRACPDFSGGLRGVRWHFESFESLMTIITMNKESAWKSSPA